jgi:hypothetical protein
MLPAASAWCPPRRASSTTTSSSHSPPAVRSPTTLSAALSRRASAPTALVKRSAPTSRRTRPAASAAIASTISIRRSRDSFDLAHGFHAAAVLQIVHHPIIVLRPNPVVRGHSVTISSTSNRSAGTLQVLRHEAMVVIRLGSCKLRAERFTATLRSSPAWCQSRHCRSARLSTQAVSDRMIPVCSASGMNWSGGMIPRSGCCQRTSASTPAIRSVLSRTCLEPAWGKQGRQDAGYLKPVVQSRQHAVAPRVPLRSAGHPPAGNPPQAWVSPTSDKKDRQDCDQAAPGLGDESAA